MITTATSKGRIVIPSAIRRKLGINEGTRINVDINDHATQIILTPITREYVHRVRGMLKGKGILKAFMALKKKEQEL